MQDPTATGSTGNGGIAPLHHVEESGAAVKPFCGRSLSVRPVGYRTACELVSRHHYSSIMPRLTKLVFGLCDGDRVVGCCTLGWGVRPEHTIRKLFPTLGTRDYLEIGKLCVADELPKNTESFFLSRILKLASMPAK